MAIIPTQTKKDLYTHIAIIISLFLVLFFGFFFVYLPWSTHHGETIKVPNLKGMSVEKMEELISQNELEYENNKLFYQNDKIFYYYFQHSLLEHSKVSNLYQ